MQATNQDSAGSDHSTRWRWALLMIFGALLAWGLPRPSLQDVVIPEPSRDGTAHQPQTSEGRFAFRTARRLVELAAKGQLADDTELSGPWFTDEHTLYFSRSRPGQRADIVRSRWEWERWSRPEPVRELNSVDDDRRVTTTADGRTLLFASNRSGTRGGFDLWESSDRGKHWSKPKNLEDPINSSDDEFDPALAPDGLTLYFVRRSSGASADLFVSHRASLQTAWSLPQPMGSVNDAEAHERSPSISADGRFLYFASNRTTGRDELAQFDLFRAPLNEGKVGSPERVLDGIASSADDLDAAFSPDGRTVVFASKREGPKQLYLSRADRVATRWRVSTAHLDRFGRAKWFVPILLAIAFAVVVRFVSRRSRSQKRPQRETQTIRSTESAEHRELKRPTELVKPKPQAPTIERPAQRSAAANNPLANWPVVASGPSSSPPTSTTSRSTANTPSLVRQSATLAGEPSTKTSERRRNHRGLLAVIAISLAAVVFLNYASIGRWSTLTQWLQPTLPTLGTSFDEVVQFREPSPVRVADLPLLARTRTERTAVPSLIAESLEGTSLSQAARWPSVFAVVRSVQAVERIPQLAPELTGSARQLAMTKRATAPALLTSKELPAIEALLAHAALTPEKPNVTGSTTLTRTVFDAPVRDRMQPVSAVASSAALRVPMIQPNAVIAISTNMFATSSLPSVIRGQRSNRVNEPSSLPVTESVASLPFVPLSEPPLNAAGLRLMRVETVSSSTLQSAVNMSAAPIERRPSEITGSAGQATTPVLPVNKMSDVPARRQLDPKLATLADEVSVLDKPSPQSDQTATAISMLLNRTEFVGPSVTLAAPLVIATTLPQSRLEQITASETTLVNDSQSSSRLAVPRTSLAAHIAIASAVDEPVGPDAKGSPLLLTVANVLVELLPQAMLSAWPKVDSVGPRSATESQTNLPITSANVTTWFVRAASQVSAIELPATDPATLPARTAIARRLKDATPAEIAEEAKPLSE